MSVNTFSQRQLLDPGVPKPLAEWRAAHYSNVRYKLELSLEKLSAVLKGRIEVQVGVSPNANIDGRRTIVLDWRKVKGLESSYSVSNALLNGKPARFEEINEHLVFSESVEEGENVLELDFTSPISTSGTAVTRYLDKEDGSEYLYSLFVPSDASTTFPVFDQPDLKAKFSLSTIAPKEWKVVSNETGKEVPLSCPAGSTSGTNSECPLRKTRFEETKPISTYVFAFAAGNFAEIVDPVPTFGTKLYVRRSKAKTTSAAVFDETLRLNRESVKYFEEYFAYRFPFSKYDLVLIPEFPFGGMEHAGATFLRESSIIFPSEPTKSDLVSRANLIFHEAAHQWFGDLVTMRWFDDLWLKEGFATFMGYKAMNSIMPEMNAWKVFYERTKQTAYQTDSTQGTTPVYQEIPNLSAAKSAYGAIVYNKAPSFLKQAEFYLGEKEFQTAVRSLLQKYQFRNATWQDLVKEFSIAKETDLTDWGNRWVTQRGLPLVRVAKSDLHEYREMGKPHDSADVYSLLQNDILVQDSIWEMRTSVFARFKNGTTEIYNAGVGSGTVRKGTHFAKFSTYIATNPNFRPNLPEFVFPNYNDYGYGIFLLDAESREYVIRNVQNEKDDFLRSMMYGSLWDSVREAELDPKTFVELVVNNVSAEKDEMIVSSLLGRTNAAFNYYLKKEAATDKLIARFEAILAERMQNSATLGQRITFYRSFLNAVSSDSGRQILKDVLSGKLRINGLSLKTKDKFDIVSRLVIVGDSQAAELLDELRKTETSDDAKRYAYAAAAGFPNAQTKARYWNDFVNNKEISESWIEAAFGNFNSIKQSGLTFEYLERALAELPNHKRNRKIFFVNGWLGSFIGGQKSSEALNTVNRFLTDNPGLDRDLRLKILENVDLIERSVRIRTAFEK